MAKLRKSLKANPEVYGTTDLVNIISDDTGVSKKDVRSVLASLRESTISILEQGDSVELRGFMKVTVTKRKARNGRNPSTGEAIKIPAKLGVKMSAGSTVKKAVSG